MRYSPLALLLVLAILSSAGCIGAGGFSSYFSDFERILGRNGASAQNLLPPTLEQLNGLEMELSAYKLSVEKQSRSSDQQAILLLMETELNLIHMQQAILLGKEQAQFANLAFPSCAPESNLGKAVSFFDQASAQELLAEKNLESFLNDYPGQSAQTGIDFDLLKLALAGSKQSISQTKAAIAPFCP